MEDFNKSVRFQLSYEYVYALNVLKRLHGGRVPNALAPF
jgi:hypothetical protein